MVGVNLVTIMLQVAVFPPSFVLTVIVAEPGAIAVTVPEEETVATEVLLDDQERDLSVAFDGVTVAFKAFVSPSVIDRLVLSKLTPVTETFLVCTVIVQAAVFPPAFAVIVASPFFIAVMVPSLTVATSLFEELHEIVLFVAFSGEIVGVRVSVSPSYKKIVDLFRVMEETST